MAESNERGALTEGVFYILLSLFTPGHGYWIMQNVKELSKGRVSIGAGTMYGAINSLLEKGWIIPVRGERDSRKKEYQITNEGIKTVRVELFRLEELLENGRNTIGGKGI
jgi:DNA-binding PadR family transcriptional regulator